MGTLLNQYDNHVESIMLEEANYMTNNEVVDSENEGRDELEVDIDRMVNEGLGGGLVTDQNGLIEDTTTDTLTDTLSKVDSIVDDATSCDERR